MKDAAYQFYNVQDPKRWGTEEHGDFTAQIDKCLGLLGSTRDRVAVELGCGKGAFRYLSDRCQYIGLDISYECLRKFVGSRSAIQGDMENIPLSSQSADFILTVNALEHVPNPANVLYEIHRVLKPGGVVLLAPSWFCRPWAAKALPIRNFSELDVSDKIQKALIPVRNNNICRASWIFPRRLIREIQFLGRPKSWRFRYGRLAPNLTEYVYTDCDAYSSLDPHEAILLFRRWGYEVPSAPTFTRRMLLRHVPIIVRKPLRETMQSHSSRNGNGSWKES